MRQSRVRIDESGYRLERGLSDGNEDAPTATLEAVQVGIYTQREATKLVVAHGRLSRVG